MHGMICGYKFDRCD